jgi:tight adherence protein C
MMNFRLDRILLLVCLVFGLSIFLLTYAAAAAPVGSGKRMGLRGLKRQQALEKSEVWAAVEPVVRWLGMRLNGLLSAEARARLDQQIGLAGDFMGLLPEEVVGLSVLSAAAGLAGGWVLGALSGMGSLLVFACAGFGAIAPSMSISSAAADRSKAVNRRLPYGIDLLALAMGAGLDFPGAVRQVVEKSGTPDDPLVEEFTLVLQALKVGMSRRQALEEFAKRVPSDSVQEFVGAVVQAELRGNPVANVLRIQAEVSRQRRTVRAEEQASKAGVAMVGPLVLVFIAILILIVSPMVMKVQQGM